MPKFGTAEYSKTNKFIYYIIIGWNNALRGKSPEKKLGSKTGHVIRLSAIFSKSPSFVFLDIVYKCILGKCLTSNRAENSIGQIL